MAETESNAGVHLIQGREVTMPVRIRKASVASAMFVVPAGAAQQIIDYTGLEVAEVLPGRAICSLAFIRYEDGDLDSYHEFGVSFLVRRHDAGPRPGGLRGRLKDLENIGAFIHWLPVDQGFTLEAGRSIWGFPKEMADIPLHFDGRTKRCAVHLDGRMVIEATIKPGVPLPMPMPGGGGVISAYSCLDREVTRHVPWTMAPAGVRSRPGGARVRLGDHPVADELRRLGLDRKRALATSFVPQLTMVFEEATAIG